jgi:O-succinylbenzoate synthase
VPDLHLRLNANRSWTRAKDDGFAKYLNPAWSKSIDFLDEPCKTRDKLRDFAMANDIAITWVRSFARQILRCLQNLA